MEDVHFGGCACGAVRYKVVGKPLFAAVCHCTFCQRRLASAFAVLVSFPEEAIEITQGTLTECEHHSDVSGRWLKMRFCPQCGTTVSHAAEFRPGLRTIAGGTLDERDWFKIDRHIWVQSKLPWVTIPEGVPAYQQGFLASPGPGATSPTP